MLMPRVVRFSLGNRVHKPLIWIARHRIVQRHAERCIAEHPIKFADVIAIYERRLAKRVPENDRACILAQEEETELAERPTDSGKLLPENAHREVLLTRLLYGSSQSCSHTAARIENGAFF